MGKKRTRKQPVALEQKESPLHLWLFASVLLIAVTLSYSPAWNGRPIWDDDAHMTKVELRSLGGLAQIWINPGATQQYYPLVHSVFWLEHKVWGDTIWPYHLVNIFLHALSAFLLWRILLRLKIPGAWLAAGIFALHPVQVESVAWISELKNTLSGALVLSAALLYLRFDESRKRSEYVGALALFALALMSKSVIATLPAALLVIFWWKRGKLVWTRDVVRLLPFFALGVASGVFTAWMERTHIGAQGNQFALSFLDRCLISGRAFWFYLAKLGWPTELSFIYPRWQISQLVWWQYLFPVLAFVLLVVLWKLRKRYRGPLAAFLLFAGILFPALGFLNVYPFIFSYVADHFQYLASIAIITLASAGITLLLDRFAIPRQPIIRYAIPIALLLTLGSLTWRQARTYRDAETLYLTTLQWNPDCWLAHNNLSAILLARGKADEALGHAEKALQLRPDDVEPQVMIGDVLLRKRQPNEAIAHYEKALAIRPNYPEGYSHLANAYVIARRFSEGIAQYRKTLRLAPRSLAAHNNLAWILATCSDGSLRNGEEAVALAEQADQLSGGNNPSVLHTLAAAYAESGQTVRAIETARRSKQLAEAQGNQGLAQLLEKEIGMYESRFQ
jgi:tetratricopeptide (TPR) repeat protein